MNKLKDLLSRCKCGVYLTINQHRDYYKSPSDRLDDYAGMSGAPLQITDEVRAGIIETDTLIEIQFYPDTPIGSYLIYHYDLDKALDEALACLAPLPG